MSRTRRPKVSGISLRLIALALAPLLLTVLVIGAYSLLTRLQDERERLEEQGRLVVDNLAMAVELAVLVGDTGHMRRMCTAAVNQPDVVRAAVQDPAGATLAESGLPEGDIEGTLLFATPIGLADLPISDYPDQLAELGPQSLLGWAEVRVSPAPGWERQRGRLLRGLWILMAGLASSLVAAVWIGRGLSLPLQELGRTMARYRSGDLNARARPRGVAELDELVKGFNRMARSLSNSQRRLRREVDSATRQLHRSVADLSRKNAELESAREKVLAASREKDQFLARMSHEMRTPLNAVIGFGRLLYREADTEAAREYSRTLDRAALLLLSVIDDILDFAKLEAGTVRLEREPFDLRDCLEDAVAMLSTEAHKKRLELALVMHGDIPDRLLGDPVRIMQVTANLLSNAVKFTPSGHVFVEAGYVAATKSDALGAIRVAVSDTGIGVPTEQRERLFKPFEQIDSTHTRRYGGTGLGLAICQRLLELMGGSIEVTSAVGRGARFAFEIPCHSASRAVAESGPGPLTGLKVLLYDAQPIQVRALRSLLLGWAADVFATTQVEGLESMLSRGVNEGDGFDLVVLGLGTREYNGGGLTALEPKVRPYFSGPVLLLVGAEEWQPPESAFNGGEVGWAFKPVRRARLLRIIEQLCGVASKVSPVASAELPVFAGRRAMVVDDNQFGRSLLRRFLELREMEVVEAPDGANAIQLAAKHRWDLILMDIHLPAMDGIEVTRRIRGMTAASASTTIIAVSADTFLPERSREIWPLFDDFLFKPVSEEALDAALQCSFAGDASPGAHRRTGRVGAASGADDGQGQGPARLGPDWGRRLHGELRAQLEQIDAAIDVGDRSTLKRRVHDLKGLCGFFGLESLTDRARVLQQGAATAALDELRPQVNALRVLVAELERDPDDR